MKKLIFVMPPSKKWEEEFLNHYSSKFCAT